MQFCALLVVCVLSFAAPCAPEEPVALAPKWVAGAKFEIGFVHRAMTSQKQSGEERSLNTSHEGVLAFEVRTFDEDGAAELACTIERLEVRLDAMPAEFAATIEGPTRFSFVRPEKGAAEQQPGGDAPAGDAPPAEAPAGTVVGPLGALCRAELLVSVRPDGSIAEVRGLSDVDAAARAHGEVGAHALGLFAGGSIARFLERLWRVDDEGEDGWPRRAPGDRWTRTEERPMPYGATAVIRREYALAHTDVPGQWPIGVKGSATLRRAETERDVTEAALSLDEWREEGSLVWDSAAGRVLRRIDKLTARTAATIGPYRAEINVQTHIELEAVRP